MKLNEPYLPPSEGTFSAHQFNRLLVSGKIVDGRAGGLIFGRTFEEGGNLAELGRSSNGIVLQCHTLEDRCNTHFSRANRCNYGRRWASPTIGRVHPQLLGFPQP